MTLQLPQWLPPMVIECTAGHFPHGDESAMRDLADHFSDTAEHCRAAAEQQDALAAGVATLTRGKGGDSAEKNHRDLAAGFREQADCLDLLAEQLYENANNTELQKWTVYGFAMLLAWQLFRAAIMFSPIGARIEMAFSRMAVESALQIVTRKSLIFIAGQSAKYAAERSTLRLASNAAFWGGLQLGALNITVQTSQMIDGHRESMDWKGATIATTSGALGGAAGAVAGKKVGERWIIPRTVTLAEGTRSAAGRMLYQVGGTALVGTVGGLAGGIVGSVASIVLGGGELTLDGIGETLIPAMAGGFLGAAAHGAADIRSATRAAAPTARTGRTLAAGALALSALTGSLHSDAPPAGSALGGAVRNARSAPGTSPHTVAGHSSLAPEPAAPARRSTAELISRPAPFARAEYDIGIWTPKDPDNVVPGGVNRVQADRIAHPTGGQLPANEAPRIRSVYAPGEGRAPNAEVNTLGAAHPADPAAVGAGIRTLPDSGTTGALPHPDSSTAPPVPGPDSAPAGPGTGAGFRGVADENHFVGDGPVSADRAAPPDPVGAVRPADSETPAPHPAAGQPADSSLPRPADAGDAAPAPTPAAPAAPPAGAAHGEGTATRAADPGAARSQQDSPAGSPQRVRDRPATPDPRPVPPNGPRPTVSAAADAPPPPGLAAAAAHNRQTVSGAAHAFGPDKAGWVARPAEWISNRAGSTPELNTNHALTTVDAPGGARSPGETVSTQQLRATEPEPTQTADRAGRPQTDEQPAPLHEPGERPDADLSKSPPDTVRQQAEDVLRDYAARSGPDIPETQRLVNASNETLVEMLRGSPADATAALIEVIRRGEDKVLRWTQVAAMTAMHESVVNMDAGEGKSLVFVAHAARDAVEHGAVQVITTRDTLANREFIRYTELLGPLGFEIVRMNPDTAPPPPTPGKPTIYVGTQQDVGFAALRENWVPGRHATIDEIDEALVHADTLYLLSDGAGRPADPRLATQVVVARDILDKGILTPADFALAREQRGGPANLTEAGRRTLEQQLGRTLSDAESNRLNMAAAAKWEYRENVHYVRHTIDGQERIFIIDQTTHKVMFDPETATESRWNGGLAQAIEAKHDLTVRADPNSSKSITAQQLFGSENYDRVTGASGTARGSAKQLADLLGTDVVSVDRFHESKLEIMADTISADEAVKLRTLATDIKEMRETGRPQLILADRNDIVAQLSTLLHPDDPSHPGHVEHIAVDAKWFLEQGTRAEAELQLIFDAAGREGKVLVINMQGARGVDIPLTAGSREVGGLHVAVTGRSALSHDIDIQAQNRAARNGDPGSVRYYISPSDNLYALTDNPLVRQVVVKYVGEYDQAAAEHRAAPSETTRARLSRAEDDLRALAHPLQQEAVTRHHRAGVPVDHTSGPATRAPPADQQGDDDAPRHSPATNPVAQTSSAGVLGAAGAGHQQPLAGEVDKWPAAIDTDTLLRQAQDGHPAATRALTAHFAPTALQHVLTTLGWDPANGVPAAPVQQLAHAVNAAGFGTAQRDGWQIPQDRDVGGWLGEKLQNVLHGALEQLDTTRAEQFADARDALGRGHELTPPQLAAVGELTQAVRAQNPAGWADALTAPASRAGSDEFTATVAGSFPAEIPTSPDPAVTPIRTAELAARPATLPGGPIDSPASTRLAAETNSPTPWFGHTFTTDPGGSLLLPDTGPRNSRTQQIAPPKQTPGAAIRRAGAAEPTMDTPWGRNRTRTGGDGTQPAPFGRIDATGDRVSAPPVTESPPAVPAISAPSSHRLFAVPAAELVVAMARGTIADRLPQIVRDALAHDPRKLQDGIEKLTARQRQVLHHRFLLEQSPAETAKALGRTTDSIVTTQHTAFLRLAGMLARPEHDEPSTTARHVRGTVAEVPEYVRACLVQTVRATHALGYDGATVPTEGADTWKALEDSLDSSFTRIPESVADPVAHILDRLADPRNSIDTAVIVVDYGTNAHSYTATTIGGRTFLFDTDIPPPTGPAGTREDHHRIARVRSREEWEQSHSAQIRSTFVLEFTQDSSGRLQPLRPVHLDRPDATERQRAIRGPPAADSGEPGLPEPSRSFLRWIRNKFRPKSKSLFLRFAGGAGASILSTAWVGGAQLTMLGLGASVSMVGLMTAMSQGGTLAGKLASGPIADRLDNRKTLQLLSAAGLVTMLASGGWIALGLGGAALAIVAAATVGAVVDAIAGTVSKNYGQSLALGPDEKKIARNYALTERSLASALGRSLGPTLQPIGTTFLFFALGLAQLMNLLVLRFLPSRPPPPRKDQARFLDGARRLWRDPFMRGFLGLSVPAVLANTAAGVHLVSIVNDPANAYPFWVKALLMAAVSTGIIGGNMVSDKWIDRRDVRWTYPASLLSLAGLMAAYATTANPWILWSAGAAAGVAQNIHNKKFNDEVGRVVPEKETGGAWSTIDIVSAVAGIAGGLLVGPMMTLGGFTTGLINAGLFGAAAIGASALAFLVRNRRTAPPSTGDGSTARPEPDTTAPDPAGVTLPGRQLAHTFATLGGHDTPDIVRNARLRAHPFRGTAALDAITAALRTPGNGLDLAVVAIQQGADTTSYVFARSGGRLYVMGPHEGPGPPRVSRYDADENGENGWQPPHLEIDRVLVAYWTDNKGELTRRLPPSGTRPEGPSGVVANTGQPSEPPAPPPTPDREDQRFRDHPDTRQPPEPRAPHPGPYSPGLRARANTRYPLDDGPRTDSARKQTPWARRRRDPPRPG